MTRSVNYRWSCRRCARVNDAGTSNCAGCGFAAIASANEVAGINDARQGLGWLQVGRWRAMLVVVLTSWAVMTLAVAVAGPGLALLFALGGGTIFALIAWIGFAVVGFRGGDRFSTWRCAAFSVVSLLAATAIVLGLGYLNSRFDGLHRQKVDLALVMLVVAAGGAMAAMGAGFARLARLR